MKWQEVWIPPFKNQFGIYGKSSNGVLAFNFLFRDEELQNQFLDILNGKLETVNTLPVTYEQGRITMGNTKICLIRGWGHLTGCGGLSLDRETASKLQDDLAEYIVDRLTAKSNERIIQH